MIKIARKNKVIDPFNPSTWQFIDDFLVYRNQLLDITLARFKYTGLPETIDPRFLEYCLITGGVVALFKEDVIGDFICLPTAGPISYDLYGNYLKFTAYSPYTNYRVDLVNGDNAAVMYNNYSRTPTLNIILNYAQRLKNIKGTIRVNEHAQKTPVVVTCSENEKLSLLNAYQKYDGNQPVIFAKSSKNNLVDNFSVLNTNAPYVVDKLQTQFEMEFTEFLKCIGVENMATTKKERLVTGEVEKSQGATEAAKVSALMSRKNALDRFNSLFGLNVSVEFNDNILDGGEYSGDLYNVGENDL